MSDNKPIYLIASGDLRLSANQTCWPAQQAMEEQLVKTIGDFGFEVKRAHSYDPELKHGLSRASVRG